MPRKFIKFSRKSQAALEFLTTYGWAFLVILIMIAALSYFGILSPSKLLPDRCNFGPELSCTDYGIGSDGAKVRLRNNIGQSIIVDSFAVSSEKTSLSCTSPITGLIWKPAETKGIPISCNFADAGLTQGDKGKLNLKITYHLATGSSAFAKDVNGELFVTVQSKSILPTSCLDALNNGISAGDGVYTINPGGSSGNITVYCDMTIDGGGWTLVLLNSSYPTPPKPSWNDVLNANNIQGSMQGGLTAFDQFLGVKYWNLLGTNMRLEAGSSHTLLNHKATYTFSLNAANNYALSMSNENVLINAGGTASSGMFSYHAAGNYQLTTYDSDHDVWSGNCAVSYGNNAWWYGACWDGNFWGFDNNLAYWRTSSSEYFPWGAIWVK